jgi:hypothetical protein
MRKRKSEVRDIVRLGSCADNKRWQEIDWLGFLPGGDLVLVFPRETWLQLVMDGCRGLGLDFGWARVGPSPRRAEAAQ